MVLFSNLQSINNHLHTLIPSHKDIATALMQYCFCVFKVFPVLEKHKHLHINPINALLTHWSKNYVKLMRSGVSGALTTPRLKLGKTITSNGMTAGHFNNISHFHSWTDVLRDKIMAVISLWLNMHITKAWMCLCVRVCVSLCVCISEFECTCLCICCSSVDMTNVSPLQCVLHQDALFHQQ